MGTANQKEKLPKERSGNKHFEKENNYKGQPHAGGKKMSHYRRRGKKKARIRPLQSCIIGCLNCKQLVIQLYPNLTVPESALKSLKKILLTKLIVLTELQE